MFKRAQAAEGERATAPKCSSRRWSRRGSLRLTLALLLAISASIYGENLRKLRNSAPPEYPELAKRMHIRGIARVELTIAPDGTVKNVKELGGNPVLVDALKRATTKWKYEPAEKTTFLEVQFTFGEQ
jgi:TonB family protein